MVRWRVLHDPHRLYPAKLPDVAGEVKDPQHFVRVGGVNANAATNHLVVKCQRHCRPGQHDAVQFRHVKAGGENADVQHMLKVAAPEALNQLLPAQLGRLARHQFSVYAHALQHYLGPLSLPDRGTKNQVPLAMLVDKLNRLGQLLQPVPALFGPESLKALFREVGARSVELQAGPVHLVGPVLNRAQEAHVDQVLGLDLVDNFLEEEGVDPVYHFQVAGIEQLPVLLEKFLLEAIGGGGQTADILTAYGIQEAGVHSAQIFRVHVMALVNDDVLKMLEQFRLFIDGADRGVGIFLNLPAVQAGAVDPDVAYAVADQLGVVLLK